MSAATAEAEASKGTKRSAAEMEGPGEGQGAQPQQPALASPATAAPPTASTSSHRAGADKRLSRRAMVSDIYRVTADSFLTLSTILHPPEADQAETAAVTAGEAEDESISRWEEEDVARLRRAVVQFNREVRDVADAVGARTLNKLSTTATPKPKAASSDSK